MARNPQGTSPSERSGGDGADDAARDLNDELTDADPFAPPGKVFREWVAIPTVDREPRQTLPAEAADFARQGPSVRPSG